MLVGVTKLATCFFFCGMWWEKWTCKLGEKALAAADRAYQTILHLLGALMWPTFIRVVRSTQPLVRGHVRSTSRLSYPKSFFSPNCVI